jgi:asparagine synthase (glutamine-hydrolysing)
LVDLQPNSKAFERFDSAVHALDHRGPDHQAIMVTPPVAIGHTRLSIIDLDARAHQPMSDTSGRYAIIFNGEIYNHASLRQEAEQAGYSFKTNSDTEVLLALFIQQGPACLQKLNGFFAFAVWDREAEQIFIARDRFGIKPLVYRWTESSFAFASELKAILGLGFEKEIDKASLFTYFKFNYIPAPNTILKDHHKLDPGCALTVSWKDGKLDVQQERWYQIPYEPEEEKKLVAHDYKEAQKVLKRFLRSSVKQRLIADVPVGTFLSGGMDSSIITAIAAQEQPDIEAFSIGFPEQPYYDESGYAKEVADHLGVKHHLLEVRNQDLLDAADGVLNHMDEPFADASALNMYLLSRYAKKHVTVALSGDGGDELFGGYHKHGAEFRLRNPKLLEHTIGKMGGFWHAFPASRSGKLGNLARQLQKFSDGYRLNSRDRYWRWAGVLTEEEVNFLIKEEVLPRTQRLSDEAHAYKKRKDHLLRSIRKNGTFNEVLLSDMQMVLPNDMLFKVDMTSMMSALEVRTPLLDHNLVRHAFRLPVMFKVNSFTKKKILQDAYRDILPSSVFDRPKKGFEVPLLEWFHGPMKEAFNALCSDRDFLQEQGLFNLIAVDELKKKLYSKNPGDSAANAWALYAFQHWYKQHM